MWSLGPGGAGRKRLRRPMPKHVSVSWRQDAKKQKTALIEGRIDADVASIRAEAQKLSCIKTNISEVRAQLDIVKNTWKENRATEVAASQKSQMAEAMGKAEQTALPEMSTCMYGKVSEEELAEPQAQLQEEQQNLRDLQVEQEAIMHEQQRADQEALGAEVEEEGANAEAEVFQAEADAIQTEIDALEIEDAQREQEDRALSQESDAAKLEAKKLEEETDGISEASQPICRLMGMSDTVWSFFAELNIVAAMEVAETILEKTMEVEANAKGLQAKKRWGEMEANKARLTETRALRRAISMQVTRNKVEKLAKLDQVKEATHRATAAGEKKVAAQQQSLDIQNRLQTRTGSVADALGEVTKLDARVNYSENYKCAQMYLEKHRGLMQGYMSEALTERQKAEAAKTQVERARADFKQQSSDIKKMGKEAAQLSGAIHVAKHGMRAKESDARAADAEEGAYEAMAKQMEADSAVKKNSEEFRVLEQSHRLACMRLGQFEPKHSRHRNRRLFGASDAFDLSRHA
mmetsp:Transcript_91524/g.294095  ORF Transcript_91524/g.294095 Transcript_91524/m.294095 type:complete len:521 (-) Transcript_91524:14-1576(-)